MHIGKRLREIRTIRGMTQAKVSKDIISAPHYSNIEAGIFTPSQDTLTLLAKRLAVPATYFTHSYAEDKFMAELLQQYEGILEKEDVALANAFLKEHEKSFDYIQSLHQELCFKLLRCLALFKEKEFIAFQQLYEEKILSYVDFDILHTLNIRLQEKYDYITGLYHYIIGNHNDSIELFSKVLKISEDPLLHARLTFNIALAHYRLFHYTEALHYSEKARDCYLHLHNWDKTAECYNLMAVLYKDTNRLSTAELYIHKGIQILNDKTIRIYTMLLHNLALVYQEQEQHKKALETIENCIAIKKEYHSGTLFSSYREKLNILLSLKDETEITRTLEYARLVCKSSLEECHLRVIEGKQHFQHQRYDAYEKCLLQSIDYYLKHEQWEYLKCLPEELATYYAKKKHYKKAYELNLTGLLAFKKIYREL